ncbi:hypothetical protein [Flavobacterium sp. AG291]|uniref:hypothetical protein n=1 Tax=Flavobacterium sp. AG291 TaxID=2184000 RepID=UPI000E0A23C4|nr:hypothetical protein [Flavobacterium sp. AG291]RDI14432.1 hypothetical protein DEU42_102125 [Flavobacterium sp. AG291]
MENSNAKKNNKRSKRPLILLGASFIFFILFMSLLSMDSSSQEAIDELKSCYNVAEVKEVWQKNKKELHEDDEFVNALKKRLISFNLNDKELEDCISWLPPAPINTNVIVVPDLSNRIIDLVNNPDQIKTDKILIRYVWEIFRKATQFNKGTNDRMIIDVTDREQAGGAFLTIADSLIFDLSKNKKAQINKFYFDKKESIFQSSLDKMYSLAQKKPVGANYLTYFNNSLPERIQKPDLFNNYRNVLIILTDGYLEAETKEETGRAFYTGSYEERKNYCLNRKNKIEAINDCRRHFPNLEVLVLEVNKRKKGSKQEKKDQGTSCDENILQEQWQNWFKLLEIKNATDDNFKLHDNTIEITKGNIKKFLYPESK